MAEKKAKVEEHLAKELEKWSPSTNEKIKSDPYKTLFVARIVRYHLYIIMFYLKKYIYIYISKIFKIECYYLNSSYFIIYFT